MHRGNQHRGRQSRSVEVVRRAARAASALFGAPFFGPPRSGPSAATRAVVALEPLEERKLLTTLTGGQTFDYLQADDTIVRIKLTGRITAEFVGMRVSETTNQQIVRDLVPAPPPNVMADDEPDGVNLFNIFIADSDETGSISIAEVPFAGAPDRAATPYTGDVGNIKTANANTGAPQDTTPPATGVVYIGARTQDIMAIAGDDEADIPIITSRVRRTFGVRPNTPLFAGIQTSVGLTVGKIFIGGTVTGRVFLDGNVNTFYAGNVLTGDTQGSTGGPAAQDNNFFVAGTLRDFVVGGSVGTDAVSANGGFDYRTAFDLKIGGKLGQFRVGADFLGNTEVVNNVNATAILTPQAELESLAPAGAGFLGGVLGSLGTVSNDTQNDAQLLGSIVSQNFRQDQAIEVNGSINPDNGDYADYYGVSLIAGQTVTTQLTGGGAALGIYDPDGRLIRTDASDVGASEVNNKPFQFTADRPGIYKFAVAKVGDYDFDGPAGFGSSPGGVGYTLSVSNYGEVGVGGIRVGGNAEFAEPEFSVLVRRGDLGALKTDGNLFGGGDPITLTRGNLRALTSNVLGIAGVAPGLDLIVPRGYVGLIETTGGDLLLNAGSVQGDEPIPDAAIGLDYQVVSASGNFAGNLVTKRAIGTLRAGSFANGGVIAANTDRKGNDGVIDLIDIAGDLGTLNGGGPAISTGPSGNVRYITVGGTVYRDRFFGGGEPEGITYPAGQSVRLTDDSGASLSIAPTRVLEATDPTTGTQPSTAGQLGIVTYGIRGSGGSAIVKVTSTEGVTINASGDSGSVEIGQITANGVGTLVSYDPLLRQVTYPNEPAQGQNRRVNLVPTRRLDVFIGGGRRLDVFDLRGGNFTNIVNDSPGEIVNINAASVGTLTGGTIGIATPSTPSAVVPRADGGRFYANTFPFVDQRTGVAVNGSVLNLITTESLGNFVASGTLGRVIANSDGKNSTGRFEGIAAPVVADQMLRVSLGEGIAPAYNGEAVGGGIFATGANGYIGPVTADRGANIRGSIVATGQISSVSLDGGSIINATIAQLNSIDVSREYTARGGSEDRAGVFVNGTGVGSPIDTIDRPIYEIGSINVKNGGIIGTYIQGADVGPITVSNGFGIFNGAINTSGDDVLAGVTADGFGIRGLAINGGARTGKIKAVGTTGRILDTGSYSPAVRQSETSPFDAFSGQIVNGNNDINAYLGTSARFSRVSGVTNEGIIEDVQATGSRSLDSIEAFLIRSTDKATSPSSSAFPMRLAFANNIGSIRTYGGVEGLQVVSGGIDSLNTGGNLNDTYLNIAGRIKDVTVGRTVKGTSSIIAGGPNGVIDNLYTGRSFYGTVSASVGIGSVNIGTELGSASFQSFGGIDTLNVGTSVTPLAYIRANKNLGSLNIGGNIEENATVRARSISKQRVGGVIFGSIVIR